MSYQKLWDTARVREVLTTESRQKVRGLFMQTHRPFQRIRLDFAKEGGAAGSFISEDQLRQMVQAGKHAPHNRLFLIVGEAGSGKSELCQWLEYSADQNLSVPVHIPRSTTSAAHVAALLRERLGGGTQAALRRTPLETQAEYVALSAAVLLYEHGSPLLTPLDHWAEMVRSQPVRRAIAEHLTAAAEGDRKHRLLGDDAAAAELCIKVGIPTTSDLLDTGRALRALLSRALEQTLWLGDVRALLTALSEQAGSGGRRPLLLLEDATAFQLLGDRLLDYLLDLGSGRFDAVIGVTTGYERTRLADAALSADLTHIHQRLQARCVLTDEQGRAYGFEDDLTEFARGYMRAIRSPNTPDGSAPFGGDLYPFTEAALHRALAHLHEEGNARQTPRLFLEHILAPALLADDLPCAALDRSAYLLRPNDHIRGDDVADPVLRSLLRWYGERDEHHVVLDARIPTLWGVHVPAHLVAEGQIRVARSYVPQRSVAEVEQSDWQVELRELQAWLSDGGLYPSRETLKRGIERVMLNLGDPRALGSAHTTSLSKAEIYYARGDERLPIMLGRGSGDQPSTDAYVKLAISGADDERGLLEELAYLALSGESMANVCQNVAVTLDWAQQHWDDYHSDIRVLLTRRLGGITPERLVWGAWRLVNALTGTSWGERVPLNACDPNELDNHASLWISRTHPACYETARTLLTCHETIRRLFIGSFALRDTLLDRERVKASFDVDKDDTIIREFAQIPLASLKTLPFKIRPSGQSLYSLLAPLQRYAQALAQLDLPIALARDITNLRKREQHLDAQQLLDQTCLRDQIGELRRRCGEVGVTWREIWDTPLDALAQTAVAEAFALLPVVHQAITRAEALAKSEAATLWDYQVLRHEIARLERTPYWERVRILQQVQAELRQAARSRYRQRGQSLIGTRAYRALLTSTRAIIEELQHEDDAASR